VHYEYPLGGAESGARTIKVGRDEVLAAMRQDLLRLRGWLAEAGLAGPVRA